MANGKGVAAEKQAQAFLIAHGLQWLGSNYRCPWGEIDLIMRDKEYLVFVEVRLRSSLSFGGAAASITWAKQQKLIRTASHYLLIHKAGNPQATRFDVLSFEGKNPTINWIQNAFGIDF
jgi:putative endonuclease